MLAATKRFTRTLVLCTIFQSVYLPLSFQKMGGKDVNKTWNQHCVCFLVVLKSRHHPLLFDWLHPNYVGVNSTAHQREDQELAISSVIFSAPSQRGAVADCTTLRVHQGHVAFCDDNNKVQMLGSTGAIFKNIKRSESMNGIVWYCRVTFPRFFEDAQPAAKLVFVSCLFMFQRLFWVVIKERARISRNWPVPCQHLWLIDQTEHFTQCKVSPSLMKMPSVPQLTPVIVVNRTRADNRHHDGFLGPRSSVPCQGLINRSPTVLVVLNCGCRSRSPI